MEIDITSNDDLDKVHLPNFRGKLGERIVRGCDRKRLREKKRRRGGGEKRRRRGGGEEGVYCNRIR